ncbi:CGNR zinc finger domain-containing protein [Rhizobium redzepovicii]|uniref:CGNR zinc finger domain-containing protein n=1 Tax=Rhizobium redzepovicii TaxID=2867518 RepID=A0AAW8P6W6_9HYPH|nr:ABATE domain-containing protein [Rhizobium redzepovicii]MDR9762782.1 CGNR zinc finger domain-containing protein [Rhizobium redzepovicii]MDR9780991.1 CGNR zinc finger domain-containing protein [Rhizobium redzepovicii]
MMDMQKKIDDISLLGGHPALDFVNTVDSRGGRWGPDFLNSYDDLVAWACRLDVIDDKERDVLLVTANSSGPDAEKELGQAKDLREALYRLFLSEFGESQISPNDLGLVADMARRGLSQQTLGQVGGTIEWRRSEAKDLDAISNRIAVLAAQLLTSRAERRPVRACQGRNCGWLFLDQSRGGHRRWCSDKTCGSNARVRKFRLRSS